MQQRRVGYYDVLDTIGARVVVKDESQCYQLLSDIRAKYILRRQVSRDYIAEPKSNGYKSIHVSILSSEGWRIEIQIRTVAMDRFAESGGAARWSYKSTAPVSTQLSS